MGMNLLINQSKTKTAAIYFVMFVVLVLFGMAKTFSIQSLSVIATIIIIMVVLLSNYIEAILTVFIICPNTYFSTVGSIAICGWIAIVCALKILFLKEIIFPKKFFYLAVLIAYAFILYFINQNSSFFMASFKLSALSILLLTIPSIVRKEDIQYSIQKLGNGYVFGALTGGLLGVVHYLLRGYSIFAANIYMSRFTGLANDPNYLSATFIFAISIILVKIFFGKKVGFIDVLSLLILSFLGFLTLSRGFMLSFVVLLIGYFVSCCFYGKTGLKHILFLGIGVALFSLVFIFAFSDFYGVMIDRLLDDRASDGGGRLELWSFYFNTFLSSPRSILFGSRPALVLIQNRTISQIEHNTFVQLIYELGVVGTIIFTVCLFLPSFCYLNTTRKRRGLIMTLPVIAAVVPYFFLSALTGENFFLSLSFALVLNKVCTQPQVVYMSDNISLAHLTR